MVLEIILNSTINKIKYYLAKETGISQTQKDLVEDLIHIAQTLMIQLVMRNARHNKTTSQIQHNSSSTKFKKIT